jgi:hypothetical protein
MDLREVERTVATFYRTGRAGACRLSDGGGPFGFDIAVALLADELISGYGCDAVAETGCFLGDTTDYLARRYPALGSGPRLIQERRVEDLLSTVSYRGQARLRRGEAWPSPDRT